MQPIQQPVFPICPAVRSAELLNIIKHLMPIGFEKLCNRLLTEIGLHNILFTGSAGNQGTDGLGSVKLNEVVSLNIVFQCKPCKVSVAPHHARDFCGVMQCSGNKGLIDSFKKNKLGLKPLNVCKIHSIYSKDLSSKPHIQLG